MVLKAVLALGGAIMEDASAVSVAALEPAETVKLEASVAWRVAPECPQGLLEAVIQEYPRSVELGSPEALSLEVG